ncbi:MAG TPA: hypothetical protein VFT59_00690 [Candidatus Saccharimonadales bacterium]|nr:hypothetical protein [Candidatus Saccharimonadales bacterium]
MSFLPVLSGLISLVGTIPYIRDTIRGRTKPRVASWLVWGILTGIAAAASFSRGHMPAAVLALCMTISCLVVTALAIKKTGSASLEKVDISCLVAALVGFLLWQWFNSPEIAVLAVVAIDAVASLPTIRHAYRAPDEETLFEFVMAGLASIVALAATTNFAVTAVLYPIYIIVFDFTVAMLIIRGRRKVLS